MGGEVCSRHSEGQIARSSDLHHGKSQEETPPQDEQTQAQEALEVESPQEAHVAEVSPTRRTSRRVFYLK
jgi:hypothetical protein